MNGLVNIRVHKSRKQQIAKNCPCTHYQDTMKKPQMSVLWTLHLHFKSKEMLEYLEISANTHRHFISYTNGVFE